MRVSRWAGLCGAMVAALMVVAAPAAGAAPLVQSPRSGPAYYLSLGDSLAFGYSQAKFDDFTDSTSPGYLDLADFTGYTDDLAGYLHTEATNYSCPAETTTTMINGGCKWTVEGTAMGATTEQLLHDPYAGSQLRAATDLLSHHRWQRGVITVSIGSTDMLPVAEQCLSNPACPGLAAALKTMRSNLSTILTKLRRAAPFATIVVLAPYNPFGFAYPLSNIAAVAFDLNVAAVALLHFDRTADAFGPINVRGAGDHCALVYYGCSGSTDIHPTDAGYALIARAFEKVLR